MTSSERIRSRDRYIANKTAMLCIKAVCHLCAQGCIAKYDSYINEWVHPALHGQVLICDATPIWHVTKRT